MRTKIITIIILIFTICSCRKEQVEQHEYYRFSQQITPNGEYMIYDYARHGIFAFNSDISATELFKTNKDFREGKGIQLDGAISEWLSDDTLLVYNFKSKSRLKQPKDTLPIKTTFTQVGNFTIKTVYYIPNLWNRVARDFDAVRTTKDSIFIRTVFENGQTEILRFPLGATTIKASSDSIIHIAVHTQLFKNMDFSHRNSDGTFTTGLPGVGTTRYDFTPKKRISPQRLNDRKIFWEMER